MGEWATLWALGPGYPCPPPRYLAVTLIRVLAAAGASEALRRAVSALL